MLLLCHGVLLVRALAALGICPDVVHESKIALPLSHMVFPSHLYRFLGDLIEKFTVGGRCMEKGILFQVAQTGSSLLRPHCIFVFFYLEVSDASIAPF